MVTIRGEKPYAEQFNGREGETATLLSRCLFNSNGLGGGFAPRHLSRSASSLFIVVCKKEQKHLTFFNMIINAKIKFIPATIAFVLALTFVAFGQNDKQQQVEPIKKCSPIVEGLQFCTTTPVISLISGGQVHIDISLQNMTEKSLSIIHGNFYDFYDTKVTDSSGNKVYSFRETILKKYKEKTATPEEIGELLPINSMPRTITLAPQQEYKVQFNFSDFYDFKTKGKYKIDLNRKIPKQDGTGNAGISFGSIEVEVKQQEEKQN